MRRIGTIIILLILSVQLPAQTLIDSLATTPAHPRLLMTPSDEARIREAVGTDPVWKAAHLAILQKCDSLVTLAPATREMEGLRMDAHRYNLYRIFYLSYAWRITREQKYFDQAEKELVAMCRFTDWNPSHYLDVAEMTMAVAIGYDWLYDKLPEPTRQLLRDAIVLKGIMTSYDTSYHAQRKWLSPTNNWNQVCNTGISYGAMAVYETYPGFCRSVINRSINSITISMRDYEPDGAYAEGYGYWGYGSMYNVIFMDGLQKMWGTDFGLGRIDAFMKSAVYMNNMVGPTGLVFNYSDGAEASSLQPALVWFARKMSDASLLWQERGMLTGDGLQAQLSYRLLPALLIWGAGMDVKAIRPPVERMWSGHGRNPVAAMRTSWTDPTAIYVGVKGGSPSVTHGHMDAGSFVMDADGVRWAMDLGYQDYNSLESKNIDLWDDRQGGVRWQVYRYTSQVHNTLTVNDQEVRVKGSAPMTGITKDSNFMSARFDLSPLYKGQLASARRGVAVCDRSYVWVRDEVEGGDSVAVVRWSMLTKASVRIGNGGAVLRQQGKTLKMSVDATVPVTMKTWKSDPPPHDYDSPNPGTVIVGFEARVPAHSKGVFNVYLEPGKNKQHKINKDLEQWK